VKKGKVPKEFLWYHSSIMLAAKLMKESDETWLDLAIRAKLKVHHMKVMFTNYNFSDDVYDSINRVK
jgi:hypothetical protein